MGAFASGFVVYGIALIFGMTGTTSISGIVEAISAGTVLNNLVFVIGAGLLLVGLGFKVAVVPFHMWTRNTRDYPYPALGAEAMHQENVLEVMFDKERVCFVCCICPGDFLLSLIKGAAM